jgi:uncharacterized membrane protein YcaP (DUF421 family)
MMGGMVMAALFIRALIIYFLITFMLKLMGKRQVGEMELSELVTTLLLSEIAALPIDDPDIPFLHAIVPILLIFSAEVIITFCKTKINPLKNIFESKPVFLIERGKLNQNELAKNRISINEFLGELRIQGVADIHDAYYAILEQDGKLSVIKRSNTGTTEPGLPHTLIADGVINPTAASHLSMTVEDVQAVCKREGTQAEDVFLMQKDDAGTLRIIQKESAK